MEIRPFPMRLKDGRALQLIQPDIFGHWLNGTVPDICTPQVERLIDETTRALGGAVPEGETPQVSPDALDAWVVWMVKEAGFDPVFTDSRTEFRRLQAEGRNVAHIFEYRNDLIDIATAALRGSADLTPFPDARQPEAAPVERLPHQPDDAPESEPVPADTPAPVADLLPV